MASTASSESLPRGVAPGAECQGGPHHARFSVAEFHRLCELLPERRLELIDGEVLEVIAKGTRHTAVVHRLARAFAPLLENSGGTAGAPPPWSCASKPRWISASGRSLNPIWRW